MKPFFSSAYILKKSSGIEDLGPFVWQLFLALAVSWFLIYFMVFKGVKVKLLFISDYRNFLSKELNKTLMKQKLLFVFLRYNKQN